VPPTQIDWFAYVKEGGAWTAPLLLAAIGWLLKELKELKVENKSKDAKLEVLAERVIVLSTELRNFLFNERKSS